MSVPFKKTVFLVDAMAFRRARAESFLNPWARNESVELISLDPDEAHRRLVERAVCDMLIYSVGAPPPHEVFTEIRCCIPFAVRRRSQSSPTTTSADQSPPQSVTGAPGYFSNSTPPGSCVAGAFVRPARRHVFPAYRHPGQPGRRHAASPIACRPPDLCQAAAASRGPNRRRRAPPLACRRTAFTSSRRSLFDGEGGWQCRGGHGLQRRAARGPEFTERQYAVLVCLCQGDPNKVIGRKLGMTETTVKVHVREIMRKLGVSNRTQVAITAAHVCSDSAVALVTADSSMAVKPSISH